MSVPGFPCAIPCHLLREHWSLTPRAAVRRTAMDDGAIAQRRHLSRVPVDITAGWDMDRRQFAVFRDWWLNDLDAGALWFDACVYDGTSACLRRLRFVAEGERAWRVSQPSNGRQLVLAQLELQELPGLVGIERERAEFDAILGGADAARDALEHILTEGIL